MQIELNGEVYSAPTVSWVSCGWVAGEFEIKVEVEAELGNIERDTLSLIAELDQHKR